MDFHKRIARWLELRRKSPTSTHLLILIIPSNLRTAYINLICHIFEKPLHSPLGIRSAITASILLTFAYIIIGFEAAEHVNRM